MAQCLVAAADHGGEFEFKRELGSSDGDGRSKGQLKEGSTITQHHACTPHARISATAFLSMCAVGALVSVAVVRLRAQQLRRLGL